MLAISSCVYTQAVLAITPCVMTQAVLAVPEMECKRVLACIGRLPKTNTGVTAHSDKKILKKFWQIGRFFAYLPFTIIKGVRRKEGTA